MIRIGFTTAEKQAEVGRYLKDNSGIRKIFVFYPDIFPLPLDLEGVAVEHIRYSDIIMYKFFYRLLEEIDDDCLLIFNECMRTQNRSDLTYNCAHHYCNQTSRKIVFEYFPFIESNNDFMILLDLLNKGKYKGKSFDYRYLQDEDIVVHPKEFKLNTIDLRLAIKDFKKYEAKKEMLFDSLGEGDPDTIPRQLHIFAGNYKKGAIRLDLQYVARNSRFKMPNVTTYKDIKSSGDYIIIDFPHRRIDFNDFLKKTGMTNVTFLNSGFKVDLYYINEFNAWMERLGEFYAKAGIC